MKGVQVGILVVLIVVAGLLFVLWRGQQPQQEAVTTELGEQPAEALPPETPPSGEGAPAAVSQPAASTERRPSPVAKSPAVKQTPPPAQSTQSSTATPPQVAQEATPPPSPRQAVPSTPPPAEPRRPRTVTVPSGTVVSVRLLETLSSDQVQPGDSFTATLDKPLVVDGLVLAERGARAEGMIVSSEKAGRVKGLSYLSIHLTHLHTSDGQRAAIQTQVFEKEGPTSTKEDATKVGVGAGLGAVIGAIAGGGKGAAIGAAVGGAAGTGTVVATRGKPAVLQVETRIEFRLEAPVTLQESLP